MIRIALVFLALSVAPAFAQIQPPRWIADAQGCRFWDPAPAEGETIRWSGHCANGYADGHGTLTWYQQGALYETDEADFAHGKLNGRGVLRFTSGQTFDGAFRDQKPDGFGTLRTNDGQTFSGQWIEGCFQDGKRRAQYNAPDGCNFSS